MRAKSLACQALFAALVLTDFREYRWSAAAQDFTTPASWRSPNITLSVSERVTLASGALDRVVTELRADNAQLNGSVSYDQTAILYAYLAQFDGLTNQTLYKNRLKGWFPIAEKQRPGFLDQLPYGYAAAQAYAAYQDTDFLDHAVTAWSSAQRFTLSKDEINAGKSNVKPDFDLLKTCSGITMAAGTFWSTTVDDPQLFGLSVGYFFILSALLAKVTSNAMYLDAATLSGDFIKGHLLNRDSKLQDSISAKSTDSCSTGHFGNEPSPDSSGLFVEGMTLLTSLTKDATDIQTMKDVLHATTANTDWVNQDGIISLGSDQTANIILPRALGTLYRIDTTASDLRDYVKHFIGNQASLLPSPVHNASHQTYPLLQYNALREPPTSGSNIYHPSRVSPVSESLVVMDQITAIAPLVDAIALQDQVSKASDPSYPSDGGPSGHDDGDGSSATSAPIGAVLRAVIGGLALILSIIIFLFLRRKKQKKQRLSLIIIDKPQSNNSMLQRPNATSVASLFEDNDACFIRQSEHGESFGSDSSTTYPDSLSTNSAAPQQRWYRDFDSTQIEYPAAHPSDSTKRTGEPRRRLQLHGTQRSSSSSSSPSRFPTNSKERQAAANALAAQPKAQQQHEQGRQALSTPT